MTETNLQPSLLSYQSHKQVHCLHSSEKSVHNYSFTLHLVQPSLVAGFDKVCTPFEEKPAVHLPRQRWHRHFKSVQATANKRSLVHEQGGVQQAMCGSENYLWNHQKCVVQMQSGRDAPGS